MNSHSTINFHRLKECFLFKLTFPWRLIILFPTFFLGESMKILLEKLPSNGKSFDYSFCFKIDEISFNVEKCHGVVKPEKGRYSLELDIEVSFGDICDRCLKYFEEKVVSNIKLTLSKEEEKEEIDEINVEVELFEPEMSVYTVSEGILDVKDIVTQETIMLRPYKRLCRNECSGICQGCGANLNTEKCVCKKEVDVRWQALKKYMTNQKQEI